MIPVYNKQHTVVTVDSTIMKVVVNNYFFFLSFATSMRFLFLFTEYVRQELLQLEVHGTVTGLPHQLCAALLQGKHWCFDIFYSPGSLSNITEP